MGVAKKRNINKKIVHRKKPVSGNQELHALHALFSAVSSKSTHPEYRTIADRLKKSRRNRPAVCLGRLIEWTEPCQDKVAVVVGKIVNDDRILELPHKIRVACLAASESVREKIEKYGGKVYKLDELFKAAPRPSDFVLFCGAMKGRKAYKYFGAANDKVNPALPRVLGKKGKNTEKRLQPKLKPYPFHLQPIEAEAQEE